ncbi:hypothetical protein AAFF_G00201750 [Aldrovandia affinis]|uniref:NHS-like protein 1 n=1 Tax=Aldrovandia affinis TaxID=143900 RepID=A0AAD7SWR4_9TELE|nr:hypothetical protein AAFF_G00201750 [Aldrovandia affinis]
MVFIGTTLKSVIKYFKKKAVSNLDEESRWTVHYTAPWHQQENVFLPGTRPACVEDLHRQAKVNLSTALRECDRLRKDGFRSSQYYSQGPAFSNTPSHSSLQEDEDADTKSTVSSAEEEKLLYPSRPRTPLMGDGQDAGAPLPTPEEKMRQQAQAVGTDVIPINVSGETFDRQASVRRSLVNTDTVVRRAKKVKRRKTITGVPDNIQKELAGRGGGEPRAQSMYIPGQCSTLGRVSSSLRRSDTRDSSCQTEEVKIVPPSVRRIRAQRGQGIAAQMANFSTSSSGSISAAGDGAGVLFAPHLNGGGGGPRFHSLPRQGARVSLSSEPAYGSAPRWPEDCPAGGQPRQISRLQADETVVHLRSAPRTATLPGPSRRRSSRSTPPPRAPTLRRIGPRAQTPAPSRGDSAVSLSAGVSMETASQCSSTLDGQKDAASESSYSDGSFRNSAAAGDQWVYDTPENVLPKRPLTSSCSTPVNHVYSSLERPCHRADSASLYSMDNDGYYTSMHLDSGLKTRSHGNIAARHSMYECRQHHSQEDRSSLYSDRSLSRSISLRKAKKPPLPPARTDSLRRKPGKKAGGEGGGPVLSETLIASLQQSLQMGRTDGRTDGRASSPSQSPCSDYEDPWVLRPRSQSSVSAGSSGVSGPNVYSLCPVTPPQSDSSSLRSDYAESWGYYAERPRSPAARPASVGGTSRGLANGRDPCEPAHAPLPQAHHDAHEAKPKVSSSSPDRVHRLTSPSSGYSSQSNTPTAGTPVPSFMRALSPAGPRSKPKSSASSVGQPIFPPPAPPLPTTPEKGKSPPPYTSSPEFPPPPPEALVDFRLPVNGAVSPPPPPPPPSAPTAPPPPPLPPTATPLTLKGLKKLRPVTPSDHGHTPNGLKKPTPNHCGSPLPLITAQALQMVQLRSVRKPERLHSADETAPNAQEHSAGRDALSPSTPEKPKKPEPPRLLTLPSCATPAVNGIQKPPTPVKKFLKDVPEVNSAKTREGGTPSDPPGDVLGHMLRHSGFVDERSLPAHAAPECSPPASPGEATQSPAPKQKPPVAAKKPKLCLLGPSALALALPPAQPKILPLTPAPPIITPPQTPTLTTPQPALQEQQLTIVEVDAGVAFSPQNRTPPLEDGEETDSGTSTPLTRSRESLSSELSADSLQAPTPAPALQELPLNDDKSASDGDGDADGDVDGDGDGDAASSTTGSISSKDEENGEVFDSSTANSSPAASTNGDALEDMVTPARPRTTEDLFAAIHRSKRKVLGRRESEEERSQGHSPSPPVTPTGPSPVVSSLPRPAGPIQRSLRKSATSSDSFKALLLRKGSRSETSFRMSAAEMLRSTDPRFQRTRSESSLEPPLTPPAASPDSPCGSPSRGKRAQEEWARSEGLLPRLSPSPASSSAKYGRARVPPLAASSKYNARNRLLSSPMTVICERDGELAEEAGPARDSNGALAEDSR